MDSKNPSGAKSRAEVYDWIQCIIFALVFCVLLFVFAVRMVNVVGHSMVPTLEQSDKVVISNLFYHPKQGDVVVLRKQTLMQEPIVKRIIATEGQTVDIDFDDGVVYVDGKALDEPYVNEPVHDRENFEGKITVPEGCVFVMDKPEEIARKFKRAVTDSDTEHCVHYDLQNKPGVSNLMSIYSSVTGKTFDEIEREFDGQGYGAFKPAVGEAVIEALRPIREEAERMIADKAYLKDVYTEGARRASYVASKTLRKVYKRVGLVEKPF